MNIVVFTHVVGHSTMKHIIDEGNLDGLHAVIETIATYYRTIMIIIYRGRSWWKIKFLFFHVVMVAYFLSSKMWDRGKTLLTTALYFITYPLIPYCSYASYCGGVLFSVWGFMYVDILRITALALEPVSPFSWSNNTILGVDRSKQLGLSIANALPENKMVLSAIRINMIFIGWLSKLGTTFLGFLDIMHKIGKNSIIIMMMLRVSNLHIAEARVETASNNIGRAYSQTIDSLPSLTPDFNDCWTLDLNWMEDPAFD